MKCYIKELQDRIAKLEAGLKSIGGSFVCIGGPLNDNVLKFDKKQQRYFFNLKGRISEILEEGK